MQGMTKAERESAKWRKSVEKDVAIISKKIGLVSGAVAAGVTAMTISFVRSTAEIQRFSQVAGSSAQEFQRYAAGAKVLGIEQDKLADIFKDTSDKVGDFLTTGGGALADFFETIAPKIGVTAEEFRNLSGPQALELYVSSLEKANVSQNEMVFFLEAIASDATLLLPLLRDGAAGFNLLGNEAERAGAIIGEDALASANQFNAAMFLLNQSAAGFRTQLVSALIPTLADLSAELANVSSSTAVAEEAGEFFANVLKGVSATAFGSFASIQLLGKSIGAFAAAFSNADISLFDIATGIANPLQAARITKRLAENFEQFKNGLDAGFADVAESAQQYGDILNGIWDAGTDPEGRASERVKAIANLMGELSTATQSAAVSAEKLGDGLQEITIATRTADDSRLKEALQNQENYLSLVRELRTDEERLTEQLRERLDVLDRIGNITDEQRQKVTSRIAEAAFSSAPGGFNLAPEVGGAFSELGRLEESAQELQDWYESQLDLLATYRSERADLNEIWNEREAALTQEHQDRLQKIEQARQMLALSSTESLFGNLADVTRGFAGEQSKLYKALFTIQKAAAIAQSLVAIQQGIALASANPFPANLAAMASVAAATASIISNIQGVSLAGVAHDGLMSVPNTGTYLLEQGERVTTQDTSAKLDATLEDVRKGMNDGGMGGSVRIVNAFDTNEVVGGYMGSNAGEQVIMNIVRRNQRTIRQLAA